MLHWNRRLLCETWLLTIVYSYVWAIYGASLCSLMPSASSATDVCGNAESGESGKMFSDRMTGGVMLALLLTSVCIIFGFLIMRVVKEFIIFQSLIVYT